MVFDIFCINIPAFFLNQTDLVRLGIFHLELGGGGVYFLALGMVPNFGPNFGDREPCKLLTIY